MIFSYRFWSKVRKTDTCWLWSGSRNENGYGQFAINRHPHKAHRVAYELTYGKIEDDKHVLHTCDNPPCVRPDHLFIGTHDDNMRDAKLKERFVGNVYALRGEDSHLSKWNEIVVKNIRKTHSELGIGSRRLSRMFNVPVTTVKDILNRRTWKHI